MWRNYLSVVSSYLLTSICCIPNCQTANICYLFPQSRLVHILNQLQSCEYKYWLQSLSYILLWNYQVMTTQKSHYSFSFLIYSERLEENMAPMYFVITNKEITELEKVQSKFQTSYAAWEQSFDIPQIFMNLLSIRKSERT